jgi:hypothetical protein
MSLQIEETGTIAERVGVIADIILSGEASTPQGTQYAGNKLRALIEDLPHQTPETIPDVMALLSLARSLWHGMHSETLKHLPAMGEAPVLVMSAGNLEQVLNSAIQGFEALTGMRSSPYDIDAKPAWDIERLPDTRS